MKRLPLAIGLLAVCAFFALTFLARPIQDPDFFWHLKMGEWLWQHHAWPIPDPFAFTTPAELDQRQLFIIKGYWLTQLLYYACHAALGWGGIFCLRLALFSGFIWILWRNRQEDAWLWWGASLSCLVAIFDLFPADRPHFLSFLLFGWLYLFLDRLLAGEEAFARRHYWIVGAGMAAWGNLHGGVLLGQLLLLVALAVSLSARLPGSRIRVAVGREIVVLAVIGLAAGFLNPNASRILPALSQVADTSALMYASIKEYASVIDAWHQGGRPFTVVSVAFAAFAGIALLGAPRRQTLFSLLILAGTGVYAAKHIRYMPFFLLASLPVLVRGFSAMPWRRSARALVVAGALILTVSLAWNERGNIATVKADGWVADQDFPVRVADYVLSTGVDGRLFNLYRWGGYLLWRLGPERQVFVDGRAFDARIVKDALTAEMVSIGGSMGWREIFAKHRITYAILPIHRDNEPYRLTQAVMQDPGWRLAFASGNAVLLVRR